MSRDYYIEFHNESSGENENFTMRAESQEIATEKAGEVLKDIPHTIIEVREDEQS